jgi:predicted nucleic acid-binding protein
VGTEDERTAPAARVLERLREEEGFVPPLWLLELTNGLAAAERRGRLTRADSTRFLHLVEGLPIQVDPAVGYALAADVLDLARDYALSAYDAAYLELALRLGLPLATLDAHLREAAGRAGVAAADS